MGPRIAATRAITRTSSFDLRQGYGSIRLPARGKEILDGAHKQEYWCQARSRSARLTVDFISQVLPTQQVRNDGFVSKLEHVTPHFLLSFVR